jgi:hypothetical protein
MNSFLAAGALAVVLAFCGIGDGLKQISGSSGNSNSASNSATGTKTASGGSFEKPTLTSSQQSIQDAAQEISWTELGISWKLPSAWKKMDVGKETFNYSGPDNAALLVNISAMSADFPVDISTTAYYDQAVQQMKNGKYEKVRYLEIDGIKGVEWIEAPPEGKDDPRRHQWIGYRSYLGQTQMLNVMTAVRADNFAKNADTFPAILYSMKATK